MKRVLLIDDSRTARAMLKRIFAELGDWDVIEAENGQDALDALEKVDSVDLACIDWNMPVMNGLEFISQAKKRTRMKGTWMIMVTSETEMSNMYKAMTAGANEYVMKPYTKEVILAKLDMMGLN
jgi:two-component system chemotaxis response regulator CheY